MHGGSPFDDDPPPPPPRDRVWLHVVLFLTTFAATTLVGADFYASFLSDLGYRRINVTRTALLVGGLWYSVPALLILGSHEMGHYFACRYYGISATLPYFIPAPIVSLFGTLGAVIRIREPLRTKRILFDVGVAGPLAGFVVLLPALILGIRWSEVMRQPPPGPDGVELGEPMLFQLVTRLFFGRDAGRLHAERASDGVRVDLRSARDRAQPAADRTARRRPSGLRQPRNAREVRHLRDARRHADARRDRRDELAGLGRADSRAAAPHRLRASADGG